jgi:hypothetical protein
MAKTAQAITRTALLMAVASGDGPRVRAWLARLETVRARKAILGTPLSRNLATWLEQALAASLRTGPAIQFWGLKLKAEEFLQIVGLPTDGLDAWRKKRSTMADILFPTVLELSHDLEWVYMACRETGRQDLAERALAKLPHPETPATPLALVTAALSQATISPSP